MDYFKCNSQQKLKSALTKNCREVSNAIYFFALKVKVATHSLEFFFRLLKRVFGYSLQLFLQILFCYELAILVPKTRSLAEFGNFNGQFIDYVST